MIPVYQTIVDDVDGNCFSACIASILELDISEVPYFHFYEEAESWLWGRGYSMKTRGYKTEGPPQDQFIIVDGPRMPGHKRGHAVIMNGQELIHDPLPDGNGLYEFRMWSLITKEEI